MLNKGFSSCMSYICMGELVYSVNQTGIFYSSHCIISSDINDYDIQLLRKRW